RMVYPSMRGNVRSETTGSRRGSVFSVSVRRSGPSGPGVETSVRASVGDSTNGGTADSGKTAISHDPVAFADGSGLSGWAVFVSGSVIALAPHAPASRMNFIHAKRYPQRLSNG